MKSKYKKQQRITQKNLQEIETVSIYRIEIIFFISYFENKSGYVLKFVYIEICLQFMIPFLAY